MKPALTQQPVKKAVCKFTLKQSPPDRFYFQLLNPEGFILLTSETYTTKRSATAGIAAVRVNAPLAERYVRAEATNLLPCFILKDAAGERLGYSQAFYDDRARDISISYLQTIAPGAMIEDQTAS